VLLIGSLYFFSNFSLIKDSDKVSTCFEKFFDTIYRLKVITVNEARSILSGCKGVLFVSQKNSNSTARIHEFSLLSS